jgi:TRAP-type C4-dicarboxylate transport system permease small subunit
MLGLSRIMAILGGIVLVALIVLTCASITGRLLNGGLHSEMVQGLAPGFAAWVLDLGIGPVNGDFELVEAGVAFSIFAFLPLCQIGAGHASVDIVTGSFPRGVNRFLGMVIELIFAAVLVLIAVQLFSGMLAKKGYGETSFLLQFPVWWGYAASLVPAATAAVVGVYMAAVRVVEVATGRVLIADGEGAGH